MGGGARADTPEVLRASASTSWNMPYASWQGEQLSGGIVFDLVHAIGKAVQMPVTFVPLPRKRIDAASLAGDIDLRCYSNPVWTDIPDQFQWSAALFDLSNVVFGTEKTPNPQTLAGLQPGALVSTVLGYRYPDLEPLFDGGRLRREDTPDQEKVMLKMSVARTPYAVSDPLHLLWYRRITPNHRLSSWTLTLSNHAFHCAVPKNGRIPAVRLLKGLEYLKKSGKIDAILQRYQ